MNGSLKWFGFGFGFNMCQWSGVFISMNISNNNSMVRGNPTFLHNFNVQLSSSQHTWHISLCGFRSLNEILIFGQCVYFKCRWCIWKGYAFEQELLFQFFVRVQPIVIWAMCLFFSFDISWGFFFIPFPLLFNDLSMQLPFI